jgi:hypothetical protein
MATLCSWARGIGGMQISMQAEFNAAKPHESIYQNMHFLFNQKGNLAELVELRFRPRQLGNEILISQKIQTQCPDW